MSTTPSPHSAPTHTLLPVPPPPLLHSPIPLPISNPLSCCTPPPPPLHHQPHPSLVGWPAHHLLVLILFHSLSIYYYRCVTTMDRKCVICPSGGLSITFRPSTHPNLVLAACLQIKLPHAVNWNLTLKSYVCISYNWNLKSPTPAVGSSEVNLDGDIILWRKVVRCGL